MGLAMNVQDFTVTSLGTPTIPSPIQLIENGKYTNDSGRLLFNPHADLTKSEPFNPASTLSFEVAGPREKIYFDPKQTKAAIVTCGGLCPGLNAVIRALVMQLWYRYEVRNIVGVPYGYSGLAAEAPDALIDLTPEHTTDIHEKGGTILGTTRGTPPTAQIVDALHRHNINILFCIGGDGTMRGALAIANEVKKRHLNISIVGIPKTIDNDIPFVRRSFGFETAVAAACQTVVAAHEEARGTRNGIGLVKLMGRTSGYIAANAAIATGHANFCLIPEVPFKLEGKNGLFALLEKRLRTTSNHAVVVVAEGAGQDYVTAQKPQKDKSGNAKLGDIGVYLKDRINEYFAEKNLDVSLKYIDPSYLIRSIPPNTTDLLLCTRLAQSAVHAAMAGKTAMMIGYWHGEMTHVPLAALADKRQTINPAGQLWFNVLEATGQPMAIL